MVIVLVHGWALSLEMWEPQARSLARNLRVIRIDRRGFGLSGGAPDLDADASDVRSLFDELGIERAALLGMSQGARVALSVAAADERVACLILDGAPADERLGIAEAAEEIPLAHYRELLRSEGLAALQKALSTHPFLKLHTRDPRAHELLERILRSYRAADLGAAHAHRSGSVAPIAPDRLSLPVLVLSGEHDSPERRRIADALAALLPHATRATVPRAGHLANLDNPAAYDALVTRFVARHMAASSHLQEPS